MKLWALIRNEFLREFSSGVSIVYFLVLPLLFIVAVGAGLSPMMDSSGRPDEIHRPIEVLRQDDGALARAFVDALREVNLQPREVLTLTEEEFGLMIPADFSARLLAGQPATVTLHEAPMDSAAPVVEEAVNAARGRVGGAVLTAQLGVAQVAAMLPAQTQKTAFFASVLTETLAAAAHPLAVIQVHWAKAATSANPISGAGQAAAGQMVTWVQITLLGIAEVLVDERARGTLRRMLITPTRWVTLLGGKLLAHLLLGLTQIALLIVGGELLFHVGWGQSSAATALVSVAFALATVSLGVWLATLVKTRKQASSITMGLSLTMAALGGAWWPLEITPPAYRNIAHLLPTTWAMQAYDKILTQGAAVSDVWLESLVLLGFAAVFVALGLRASGKLRA